MRVLVIDDEPTIRSIVVAALEGTAEVLEAADGPTGLALLDDHVVDVVILDVMLPGMSGHETLGRLRRGGHGDVRVLMLTAKAGEQDHVAAYRAGADGYLTKPFDVTGLCEAVADISRRNAARRETVRRAELARAELLCQFERQLGPELRPASGSSPASGLVRGRDW